MYICTSFALSFSFFGENCGKGIEFNQQEKKSSMMEVVDESALEEELEEADKVIAQIQDF